MEAAIGMASGLIGSLVNLLANEAVGAYVASTELGLNSTQIKDDLLRTQVLLCEADRRAMSNNAGLEGLLRRLSAKVDEAEDALDELHYFMIQEKLDNTNYTLPDLGDDLRGHARHGRHALRHIVGNCLTCFSCSCSTKYDDGRVPVIVTNNPHNATEQPDSGGNGDRPVDKLLFDRVAMSRKIKSVIEELHSLCDSVTESLKIVPHHSSNTAIKRPIIGSTSAQSILYGRTELFEQTVKDIITCDTNSSETLSVLPIVGPGGIGKTTFTQHLYNDKRIQEHFDVKVWVCVSDFDVLRITKHIHDHIRESEKQEGSTSHQTTNTSLDLLQIYIGHKLKSKRFLIAFDDLWECNSEDWGNLLAPLMKGEAKGNMILLTTRSPSKADTVKTTDAIALKGLHPEDFFTFFEELIFAGNKPEYYQEDLANLARDIANKLKGSPLAAKTVSRILKRDPSREHWTGVLKNNKWQKQENSDDIMPSLRISYDYLPFHLKKCFPYFALFPEDYRFNNLEITYFWIAIGIIEKDENYMEQLVDNGFLVKENYVLHDLLHELSRSVSSQECLNINSGESFRADAVPKSIRLFSITMEEKYDVTFRGEMIKLRSKVDIVNLRALMVFREYSETINEILEDTFMEIQGLRVLFMKVKSLKYFPPNLSKLIHLRYLKVSGHTTDSELTLPSTLPRFYHLKLLDLSSWYGRDKLPKDISRLINLHYLVARIKFHSQSVELHSDIPEVGKMKCLKELTKFCVKKEIVGFELSELGELTELGGELSIYNLKMVATKEEAMEAKLMLKADLKKLELLWGTEHDQGESDVLGDSTELSDVIDGLEPHPNLQSLVIKNHGGSTCPSWLCGSIGLLMLTSLCLEDVSWTILPLGRLLHLSSLTLRNIPRLGQIISGSSDITDRSCSRLKEIILFRLPEFTEWVVTPNARWFPRLELVHCYGCPNLRSFPFLEEGSGSYTSLSTLRIFKCPKLLLPPMPATHIDVPAGPSRSMEYDEHDLPLTGHSGAASKFTWAQLPKLTSLRELRIEGDSSFVSMDLLSNHTSLTCLQLVDCENLEVDGFNPLIAAVNLKEFAVHNRGGDRSRSVAADLLSEMVVASRTDILLPSAGCFRLETLGVDSISAMLSAPVCSLFATTLHTLIFELDQRVESFTEEEENALQLLTSLQHMYFWFCQGLPSLPGGLHKLSSLWGLHVGYCPKVRSLPKEGLPASLRLLIVEGCTRELCEQAKEFEVRNPYLRIDAYKCID
ncbi:unnamed protein product [Triticum turgidum subsp. durum]|uniref:NB-ARC domain-containing protein n=1 Tax=Triticum turgidum subsp. durum TaxID=4567 RepID=A0A9R1C6F1_TRITD|nr:unnamed protein product [Triticum turgidum subsp. durum]